MWFSPPNYRTLDFLHSMCPAAVLGGDLGASQARDAG